MINMTYAKVLQIRKFAVTDHLTPGILCEALSFYSTDPISLTSRIFETLQE
jgi:hypothetical protein